MEETQIRSLMHQILYLVNYLHSNKIVHRDLQLDNFCFAEKSNSTIKLMDLTCSMKFGEMDKLTQQDFAVQYLMSPEVFKGTYTTKCDVWALGIMFFQLATGQFPFKCDFIDDNVYQQWEMDLIEVDFFEKIKTG
jgi:serine/threonine protein kinase